MRLRQTYLRLPYIPFYSVKVKVQHGERLLFMVCARDWRIGGRAGRVSGRGEHGIVAGACLEAVIPLFLGPPLVQGCRNSGSTLGTKPVEPGGPG